jgi:energy-coupling factor transporter ATP-binding protein EcfA2
MIVGAGDAARLYGGHAAQIIIDCKRRVALTTGDAKLTVYRDAVKTLADAVADQWLPKQCAADVANELAVAHDFFSLTPENVQQIIADAFHAVQVPKPIAIPPSSSRRQLVIRRASELAPEKLNWVWPGRIAEGKLVLVGGPPGLGKSLLTTFMAATISTGSAWPCGEGSAPIGSVLILSAEDGMRDTIVPRLIAAGANTKQVHIIEAKLEGSTRKTFNLKTDVDLLEERARQIGDVRLIIVDPISAYMGGSDGNNNAETRETLEPLADMANRLGIAVVAVTHLNKGNSGSSRVAMNRFTGSIAYVAAARAAFGVVADAEDRERRLFLLAKSNLGPPCDGLVFRVEQRLVADDILAANVFFESEHVTVTIDEALTTSENGHQETSTTDDVVEFLQDVLSTGPMEVGDVELQARAAGLLGDDKRLRETKPFRNARKKLGVTVKRVGFGPGAHHILSLPDTMRAQQTQAGPI